MEAHVMASNPQAAMVLSEQVIVYRGEGYKPRSIGIRGCAGPMERDLWLVCVYDGASAEVAHRDT